MWQSYQISTHTHNIAAYNTFKDMKLRSTKRVSFNDIEIENELALFKGQRISAKTLLFRVSKKNQPKIKTTYKRKLQIIISVFEMLIEICILKLLKLQFILAFRFVMLKAFIFQLRDTCISLLASRLLFFYHQNQT